MRTDNLDHGAGAAGAAGPGRLDAGAPDKPGGYREYGGGHDYDEYRVKLYKVACRAAREQREQLRLDWEARNRERD